MQPNLTSYYITVLKAFGLQTLVSLGIMIAPLLVFLPDILTGTYANGFGDLGIALVFLLCLPIALVVGCLAAGGYMQKRNIPQGKRIALIGTLSIFLPLPFGAAIGYAGAAYFYNPNRPKQ